MKVLFSGGVCAAALMALNMAAFAQATQSPAQSTPATPAQAAPAPPPQAPAAKPAAADQTVTLTGCIQREADFRKARDAGKGGVAGTGVGAGNEFVLVASASPAPGAPAAPAATGTSGSAMAYELTGANEGQAAQFVGQRVEIMGRVKAGDPAGGPTAGKPPAGVDVASADLKLRELEITSIKASTGSCTP